MLKHSYQYQHDSNRNSYRIPRKIQKPDYPCPNFSSFNRPLHDITNKGIKRQMTGAVIKNIRERSGVYRIPPVDRKYAEDVREVDIQQPQQTCNYVVYANSANNELQG